MHTIVLLNPVSPGVAEQLLTLQRAAYRVEADLIGFDGIPPLHETLDELIALPSSWIGIRIEGRVVASLAYRVEGGICNIDRLVVAPDHFGRGFGSALVASLLHHPCITSRPARLTSRPASSTRSTASRLSANEKSRRG